MRQDFFNNHWVFYTSDYSDETTTFLTSIYIDMKAILMTADWIANGIDNFTKRNILAGRIAISFFALFFLNFDVIQPLYYSQGGLQTFATELKSEANKIKPWSQWQVVMLDPESKSRFYLQLSPQIKNYEIHGKRNEQTETSLINAWPVLKNQSSDVIFITRKVYMPLLKNLLPGYKVVAAQPNLGERILKIDNMNSPVAFIPQKTDG